MRKIIIPILLISLLAFISGFEACRKAIVRVHGDKALPEETGTVKIRVANIEDVRGIQIDVYNEGDYLKYEGCEVGQSLSGQWSCLSNELDNGCVRILVFSFAGDIVTEGISTMASPLLISTYYVYSEL